MQYAKHLWTSGPMSSQRRLKVREFNDVITCYLCRGYLINPATVDNCIHSYCRSCIVQHLRHDDFCPQCKSAGGKPISVANLKSDEILRGLIFKLVPGLYQQERERTLHFIGTFKSDDPNEAGLCELEDEFFAPTEAISLSLEYHPALLAACSEEEVPPVRYLQCPAGVTVHHLKRFLRSKYDIDPENRQVEVEVIYEEEVLPNDFTLMDVGYCYSWKRNEPMRFTYRILVHSGSAQDVVEVKSSAVNSEETRGLSSDNPKNVPASPSQKSVRVVDDKLSSRASWDSSLPPPMTYTVFKSKAQECRLSALSSNNNNNNNSNRANRKSSGEKDFDENQLNGGNGPVKVIIARKPSEWRKNSPKRSHSAEEASYVVANDFKSLRSNDLRYSDYTVTSTTSSSSTSKGKQSSAGRAEAAEAAEAAEERHQAPKCDIVVSRPQSQLPPSPSPADDDASFSQLRTASRKSSPPAPSSPKPKNVPKLKIELGSLKTKITIPKPKSADANGGEPLHKKSKHRKYSLEERPTVDKVDLETYVKHIGLKPIEVVTAPEALDAAEKDKYSSDASPMSSSSSTTSSSNGNFLFASSSEISSSSHKKRKKKHSKDPSGKRRKLHAEISSQPADESLKMKVKITAAHVHKAHRAESRKSSSRTQEDFGQPELVAARGDEASRVVAAEDSRADEPTEVLRPPDKTTNDNSNKKSSPSVNMSALNQTLSEESLNISNLMIGKRGASGAPEEPSEVSSPGISLFSSPTENLALPPPPQPPLPKPISSIKDIKIPSSPPLPPSLFKTAPLTLTSAAPPTASNLSKTPASSGTSLAAKPPPKTDTKPPSPVQPASVHRENHCGAAKANNVLAKTQSFAVPNPPRSVPSSPRLCALPTSIASAAHKQLGAQLKRSASLDESCVQNALVKQQEKAVRKSAYAVSTAVRLNSGPPKEFPLQKPKPPEKSFYSPLSSCSHDLSKRAHLPFATPGAGAPKIGEAFSMYSGARMPTQPALTITTHPKQTAAQQMINFLPYTPLNKPALEIVRITSNQVPADLQPLPPKSTRPAQPPIPLLKIKKPGQQSTATRSPPIARSPPGTATSTAMKTSSCLQQSPPALINMRNTIPLSVAAKAVPCKEDAARAVETKTNGSLAHEKPKAPSLRDFRPTSKDGSVEILDLSAGKPQDAPRPAHAPAPAPAPAAVPTPTSTSIGTSLEAALNKIKQNITSCTVANSLQLSKLAAAKASSEDLQNLHMLSESATSREKIAIGSPSPQKLFEMPKSQQPSVVRQQNASVRSIPNPSALAFRNQPPLSMLSMAAVASPPSAALQPTANPPSLAADAKSLSLSAPVGSSPKSPNTPQQTSPRTKKHPSIDQVAANLNMRAAAAEAEASAARAEASAARAASLEESSLVSSTSAAELKSPQPASTAASVAEASSSQVSSSAATTAAPSAAVSTSAVADSAPVSAPTTATASASSPTPTPATPKTSFKSISSLVASTSSTASVVASSV